MILTIKINYKIQIFCIVSISTVLVTIKHTIESKAKISAKVNYLR